jgi:hypothetical protein
VRLSATDIADLSLDDRPTILSSGTKKLITGFLFRSITHLLLLCGVLASSVRRRSAIPGYPSALASQQIQR